VKHNHLQLPAQKSNHFSWVVMWHSNSDFVFSSNDVGN